MNLTTDPWIPVIAADDRQHLVSLEELFASAHELRDFATNPHEKVALFRLLICITQAALDGPEDYDAWGECREAIQPAVQSYLDKWMASFELFGDGPRFLQLPGLKPVKEDAAGNPATKLDLSLASGNNPTFFDNDAGKVRTVDPGRLALTLLTFQCFAPGGRIGVAKWNGVDTPGNGSSNHAPCTPSTMLHTYLHGDHLLESVYLNLINKEEGSNLGPGGWGRPIWELPVTSVSDKEAIANATGSYLGRLVPLSRSVFLDLDGRQMILANGLDYPLAPIFREPAATMIQRDEQLTVLGGSLERGIWRQLPSIAVRRHADSDSIAGPLALRNLDGAKGCTIWIGALATDKAKIEDVLDASYDIPAGMFRDFGRKLYEEGVALADLWQDVLSKSVKAFAEELKQQPAPYGRARHYFWTAVEQHVPLLLKLTDKPEKAGDLTVSQWGNALKESAHAAYEFTCQRQTPRQIQAYAIGLKRLSLPKPKDQFPAKNRKSKATQ